MCDAAGTGRPVNFPSAPARAKGEVMGRRRALIRSAGAPDLYIASPKAVAVVAPHVRIRASPPTKAACTRAWISSTARHARASSERLAGTQQLGVLEGLVQTPYACGEELTEADLTLWPTLSCSPRKGLRRRDAAQERDEDGATSWTMHPVHDVMGACKSAHIGGRGRWRIAGGAEGQGRMPPHDFR